MKRFTPTKIIILISLTLFVVSCDSKNPNDNSNMDENKTVLSSDLSTDTVTSTTEDRIKINNTTKDSIVKQ